ncbi:hypothetical protein Bcep1808_0252 [Burkholderia vietnamiensis G4]|uniref:Uncharacterized protein n=1 Tax=Burkholderia vietnamiensis (strain G4 / LMG 22486) TaxID=269482 RepID=A4JAG5_BURVG|nr:hypothetical protein Bcep1808_0252 [Burkholderia vietnamiensis G4]
MLIDPIYNILLSPKQLPLARKPYDRRQAIESLRRDVCVDCRGLSVNGWTKLTQRQQFDGKLCWHGANSGGPREQKRVSYRTCAPADGPDAKALYQRRAEWPSVGPSTCTRALSRCRSGSVRNSRFACR